MMVDAAKLIDELTGIVGSEFIHSTTSMDVYGVDGRTPWAVVAPGDADQVAAVLALAHREELAVIPKGGGTTMGMGHPPERLDIVMGLQRLNRVLEHEPADLTATAQAGITIAQLHGQLGSRGQWWPVAPPRPSDATLGGVLATNTAGPKRLLYGTARDLLIGIKVVHADGAISKAGGKVTKNVTGYDMMKLYIGSLGTLAVIVEATLKLRPLPPVQQLVWSIFTSAEAGVAAARRLLSAGLQPNAVELINPPLCRTLQQSFDNMGESAGWSLLVGVDGPAQSVARQLRDIAALSRDTGASAWWTGVDDGRLWQALQNRFRPHGPEPMERLVIRTGTVRTRVGGILGRINELERRLSAPVELTARFGNGLVYATLPLHGDADEVARAVQALTELRACLATERGYLVVESAPPSLKARFDCWGDVGPEGEVMAGLKHEFDPRRVLNPGRFINHL